MNAIQINNNVGATRWVAPRWLAHETHPENYRRGSLRLKGFDYSQSGIYFITICTNNRECVFGNIINDNMQLNQYRIIVKNEWIKTSNIRNNIELDVFMIMPNHFHGIIIMNDAIGATQRVAPTLKSSSVGSIIGQFKSVVTKCIHSLGLYHFKWQRNYYEHIIRNEDDLYEIRNYIINNPLKWSLDKENPATKCRGGPLGRPCK